MARTTEPEAVDRAIRRLHPYNVFRKGDASYSVLFLLPVALWRPLKAGWWRGKEVSVIGGDPDGNYYLRHSDGTVRIWNHRKGAEETIAPSIRDFVGTLVQADVP